MTASQLGAVVAVKLHSNATADALLQWVDVNLTNMTGAAVGKGSGRIYVLDDD